jgi:hypothetical protein
MSNAKALHMPDYRTLQVALHFSGKRVLSGVGSKLRKDQAIRNRRASTLQLTCCPTPVRRSCARDIGSFSPSLGVVYLFGGAVSLIATTSVSAATNAFTDVPVLMIPWLPRMTT